MKQDPFPLNPCSLSKTLLEPFSSWSFTQITYKFIHFANLSSCCWDHSNRPWHCHDDKSKAVQNLTVYLCHMINVVHHHKLKALLFNHHCSSIFLNPLIWQRVNKPQKLWGTSLINLEIWRMCYFEASSFIRTHEQTLNSIKDLPQRNINKQLQWCHSCIHWHCFN